MLESRLDSVRTPDGKKATYNRLLEALWPVHSEPDVSHINPREPTQHQPGSFGKMLVIRARYLAGVPLWNPDDARDTEDHGFALSLPELFGRAPDESETEIRDDENDHAGRTRLGLLAVRVPPNAPWTPTVQDAPPQCRAVSEVRMPGDRSSLHRSDRNRTNAFPSNDRRAHLHVHRRGCQPRPQRMGRELRTQRARVRAPDNARSRATAYPRIRAEAVHLAQHDDRRASSRRHALDAGTQSEAREHV